MACYIPQIVRNLASDPELNSYTRKTVIFEFDGLYNELQTASSTSSRRYRIESMKILYNTFTFLSDLYDYVANATRLINTFVKRLIPIVHPKDENIHWENIKPMTKNINQFYLIRCFNEYRELVYSKVGTTTRETSKRMKEHLRSYAKDGVTDIYVDRLIDCGDMDPEGLESEMRAHYIKKHPHTFKKNDRFVNVIFDLKEADKIIKKYLEIK